MSCLSRQDNEALMEWDMFAAAFAGGVSGAVVRTILDHHLRKRRVREDSVRH